MAMGGTFSWSGFMLDFLFTICNHASNGNKDANFGKLNLSTYFPNMINLLLILGKHDRRNPGHDRWTKRKENRQMGTILTSLPPFGLSSH